MVVNPHPLLPPCLVATAHPLILTPFTLFPTPSARITLYYNDDINNLGLLRQGQLLCGWWVTTCRLSQPLVLYMYDWFFNRCITLRWLNWAWNYCLDDGHHLFNFSVIRTILSTCFIYWLVSFDLWCYSAVVTHHLQITCLMRNCGLIFL